MSDSPKRNKMEEEVVVVDNYINGKSTPPVKGQYMDIVSPSTGKVIGKVAKSTVEDIDLAVQYAKPAFASWSQQTLKTRAAKANKLHSLIEANSQLLGEMVVRENGKNIAEALAGVAKGNETCEWASTIPSIAQGKHMEVSRGVRCEEFRDPVGIVASIVPFNFPVMVPFWTLPVALVTGNVMIMKPSEKVPMSMCLIVADLVKQAGFPDGVFQVVNGAVEVVNGLCDHPSISAVTFVGSSHVAELVYKRCTQLNKRVLALGGAKNHLVALPDCDLDMTSSDVVGSFAGCAGQRCMAASVLLVIGEQPELIKKICEKASALTRGQASGQIGPVIDQASHQRILRVINDAEKNGVEVLVDGRHWAKETQGQGTWVGPTVLRHKNKTDEALHLEIFGPVISILHVKTWEEAVQMENENPHGNAAGVYTTSGAAAEFFANKFRAAMIGINIGVPVPREPFSFGGLYGTRSKFGDHDITGDGGLEFFTTRRKVTTKWGKFKSVEGAGEDKAQFQ
ncbi:methylmalonate-semialdehyde dehydrogenase (acylating) [Batrachochytrium salamandrivorans]|nr:methylmalonate-semialdehyde dehydrogenase (acylating) [Batrachochytrium salamandrivorans]